MNTLAACREISHKIPCKRCKWSFWPRWGNRDRDNEIINLGWCINSRVHLLWQCYNEGVKKIFYWSINQCQSFIFLPLFSGEVIINVKTECVFLEDTLGWKVIRQISELWTYHFNRLSFWMREYEERWPKKSNTLKCEQTNRTIKRRNMSM